MSKYLSTQDQFNKEFESLHARMRDPDLQDQKTLEIKHKKNVENTTKRYGLG